MSPEANAVPSNVSSRSLLQPVMLNFQKNRAATLGRPPPGTFPSSHTHLAAGGCPAAQPRTSINDASPIPASWSRWRSYSYHYLTLCRPSSCFFCSGLSWGRQEGTGSAKGGLGNIPLLWALMRSACLPLSATEKLSVLSRYGCEALLASPALENTDGEQTGLRESGAGGRRAVLCPMLWTQGWVL